MGEYTGWFVFLFFIVALWFVMWWATKEEQVKDCNDCDPTTEVPNGYGSERHKHYVAHEETHSMDSVVQRRRHSHLAGKTPSGAAAAFSKVRPPLATGTRALRGQRGGESEQSAVRTHDGDDSGALLGLAAGIAIGSALAGSGSDRSSDSSDSITGGGGGFDGGGASADFGGSDSSSSSSID